MSALPGPPADGSSTRRILLDSPTGAPALGYADIGRAFATVISQSEPRFAVGIFGGWGSGKTTLMRAIRNALPADGIVVAEFNAWRFEREPQLLIPLLDTIRAALVDSSERQADTKDKLRAIAARVGRVVRALASGLSAQVGLPGAVTVSYDAGAALGALSSPDDPRSAQSLYVAAFTELQQAFGELAQARVGRVVVFVDDLDRCLPANALEVLESMKLFFDLLGFVFVVGLDQEVVERAIRARYASSDDGGVNTGAGQASRAAEETAGAAGTGGAAAAAALASQKLSREYVKKIFQVPYSLPAMLPQQLDELLIAMYHEAGLGREQLADLTTRVRPYLGYVAVDRRINPREVKRFINAYTLQTLVRPELDRDTVLALQTLAFRYDWAALYDAILTDSALFADALRRYRQSEDGDQSVFEDVAPNIAELPTSLASFLRSDAAVPLTFHQSLDPYLSSLQSYTSTASWELEAFRQIGALRREIRIALDQERVESAVEAVTRAASEVAGLISRLAIDGAEAAASEPGAQAGPGFARALEQVRRTAAGLSELARSSGSSAAPAPDQPLREKMTALRSAADRAREELRLLRDYSILQP